MAAPNTEHDGLNSLAKAEHNSAGKTKQSTLRLLDPSSGEYVNISARTTGSSPAINVALNDASGNQVTSFGGGTQYTEGDVDASITGTAMMVEESNTLRPAQGDVTNGLDVDVTRLPSSTVAGSSSLPAGTNNIGDVDVASIAAGDNSIGRVKLTDGTDVADILDLTNSNPLTTAIVDGSGTQITSFGGGTQYTEGDTDASITGTALLWEDTSDTLRAASAAKPFPVTIISGAGSGGTASADDADFTAGTTSGTPAMGVFESTPTSVTDGDMGIVGITTGRRLKTSATIDAALPAGTNNIGDVDVLSSALPTGASTLAEQQTQTTALQLIDDTVYTDGTGTPSKAIGVAGTDGTNPQIIKTDSAGELQVDVLSIAAGDNNIGNVDIVSGTITTVSTVSALGTGTTGPMKAEDVGHSTGDMGIPAWGVRQDTPNATAAASNDYHYLATDMVGGIRTALYETDFAVLGTNHVKKYYTNAGAVTDGIVWSPASGKRWYVTDISINVSAAATVTLEDDKAGGDEVVWKAELGANGGWSHSFATPLFSGEDAADLIVTTTAGNVYITVTGYEI